jgi:hypothetical protein
MKFFDQHLIPGETIYFRTHYQPFIFSRLIFLFPTLWMMLCNLLFNDIVVTNKRLAIRRLVGLQLKNDEVQGRLIRSADIQQSIIGHVFGYGDVLIDGSRQQHNYELKGVSDPNGLQKAVLAMMRGTIESG